MSYPAELVKNGGTWQSRPHSYKKVTSLFYTGQPQSTSTETLYVLWVDELNTGSWHTNGYHHGTEIKVTHSTDIWSDAGTSAPVVDANNSSSTDITLRNVAGGNLLYQFAKPTVSTGGGSGGGGGGGGGAGTGGSTTQKKVFCNFW